MTPDEISQLVEAAVSGAVGAVLQATGGTLGGASKNKNKRVLEPKGVSRLDAYTGKDGTWREWSFQFRVAIKAMEASTA